jgi:hypothetical protein
MIVGHWVPCSLLGTRWSGGLRGVTRARHCPALSSTPTSAGEAAQTALKPPATDLRCCATPSARLNLSQSATTAVTQTTTLTRAGRAPEFTVLHIRASCLPRVWCEVQRAYVPAHKRLVAVRRTLTRTSRISEALSKELYEEMRRGIIDAYRGQAVRPACSNAFCACDVQVGAVSEVREEQRPGPISPLGVAFRAGDRPQ